MNRIFWDTNLFIYLFEDRGERAERVAELRQRVIQRGDELITSSLAVGELLVLPMRAGDDETARRYRLEIAGGATIVPFDLSAALIFAEIRKDRSIQIPDAIQLACASAAGADIFVTNDRRLSRKTVRGIRSIQSLDMAAEP